uniref:glycosyltransferase family 4 protein n=1 Tax=Odoribacter laneus TaxID=626933 RepID=UPI004038A576
MVNESRFEEGTEKVDVGVPYLFHAGTLTEYKDAVISTLKAFIIAVNEIKIPVKYLLAGPVSPHKKEIEGLLYEHKIENRVIFLGNLKPSEVIKYQKGAFLTVVNKNDNIQNRYGFSTKLGEILWSGTPVITTTVGEANYYLKDGESAYIVEPHNPRLIAEKIIQAFSNPEESRKIAEAGKKIAQDSFNCLSQGKRLASFFSSFSF